MELNRSDGQRVVAYMAVPGSADHDAMVLLDLAGSADRVSAADPAGVGPKPA